MADRLKKEIVGLATSAGSRGASMGEMVDRLTEQGFAELEIEQAVWELIETRGLTLCGYVQRTLQSRDAQGHRIRRRSYEFTLVPWAPERDLEAPGKDRPV